MIEEGGEIGGSELLGKRGGSYPIMRRGIAACTLQAERRRVEAMIVTRILAIG